MLSVGHRIMATTSLLALALSACARDEPNARATKQPTPHATAAPRSPAAPGGRDDPGSFPDEPQFKYDLSERPGGWRSQPADDRSSAGFVAGGYLLRAVKESLWVAAPPEIEPGNRGSFTEVEMTLVEGAGAAGLFCRGVPGSRTGYGLTIGTDERWAVWRFLNGERETLDRGRLDATVLSEPGDPNLLRLICGTGGEGEPVTIAFTINATDLAGVRDPKGLPIPASGRVGLLALPYDDGRFEARFDNLAVSLATSDE